VKRVVSDLITPISLIKMIVCCDGYSFNHLQTRISDPFVKTYAWTKIDTLRVKLLVECDDTSRLFDRLESGRSCIVLYSYSPKPTRGAVA
jgi:hypothetical protein